MISSINLEAFNCKKFFFKFSSKSADIRGEDPLKGIAASALVAVLFEKTEKTRQQLFVCWKFTACCL